MLIKAFIKTPKKYFNKHSHDKIANTRNEKKTYFEYYKDVCAGYSRLAETAQLEFRLNIGFSQPNSLR